MVRSRVRTFRHKIGKNRYLIIYVSQKTSAATDEGNAIANNALNIKIFKKDKPQHGKRK